MKKMKNSFGGILVGIIFIIVGSLMLIINEHNNVKNIKDVKELRNNVIDVKSDNIDSKNDGKLVNVSGKLIVNDQELYDSTFGVREKTAKLVRKVEMYQYKETSSNDDNGNTNYTYEKVWSDELIDSSDFNDQKMHNPSSMPYSSKTLYASNAYVGKYHLSNDQLKQLKTEIDCTDYNSINIPSGYKVNNGVITNSVNVDNPAIGDVRITISYNNSDDLTILAKQDGNNLINYVSKNGRKYNKVADGVKDSAEMIQSIENGNNTMKWIFRILGTILNIIGFIALFGPIQTLASFIPIFGALVNTATSTIGFIIGLMLSLIIIAISWLIFRPLLAIGLLAICVILIILLISLIKKGKQNK